MSSHDKLSLYLMELQAQRDADRQEMDEHLKTLHLREFNQIYKAKLKV